MTDLVAELRERLRLFAGGRLPGAARRRDPGALDLGERLALSSRMLAEGLDAQGGVDAGPLTEELRQLAAALEVIPTPLEGSDVAANLEELVLVMDDLVCAWDRRHQTDLAVLWRRVREAGDQVWGTGETPSTDRPEAPARPSDREIWLLVSGSLRRHTLQHRLRDAGYTVVTLDDTSAVMSRLVDGRPAGVLCDDAAPGRFHHRLQPLWTDQTPPLVLVRAGANAPSGVADAWLPPYRPEDLRALLS